MKILYDNCDEEFVNSELLNGHYTTESHKLSTKYNDKDVWEMTVSIPGFGKVLSFRGTNNNNSTEEPNNLYEIFMNTLIL